MKRRYTIYAVTALIALIIVNSISYETTSSTAGSPAARCGAPADGGATCTGCHGGATIIDLGLNNGWIVSDIPAGGYVPGETYTFTATATQVGSSKFGFQMSPQALNGAYLGTMIVTDAVQTQIVGTKYITHKSAGTAGSGSKSWSFDWIAPVAGTGTVSFYACFNATNSNSSSSGDQIYKTIYTVNECVVSASVSAPVTSICSNQTASLNAQGTGSYLWSNGATTQNISVNTSGAYAVTVTNGAGCTAASTPVSISVTNVPASPIITSPVQACVGATVALSVDNFNPALNYSWNIDGTSSIAVDSSSFTFDLSWGSTGTYNYSFTASELNCISNPTSGTIQIGAEPIISTSAIPESACPGSCFPISITGAASVSINGAGVAIPDSLCATGSGSYDIVALSTEGCQASSLVQIDILNAPNISLVQTANTLCISDTNGITSSVWALNGNTIAGNTDCIDMTESGTYSIIVTGENGCTSTSSGAFTLTGLSTLAQLPLTYNNPVQFNLMLNNNPEGQFILSDLSGRVVRSEAVSVNAIIALNTIPEGIYLAQIISENQIHNFQIIKQ